MHTIYLLCVVMQMQVKINRNEWRFRLESAIVRKINHRGGSLTPNSVMATRIYQCDKLEDLIKPVTSCKLNLSLLSGDKKR